MCTHDEPRVGVHFPLADFEQRIVADPDVLGMLYHGSLGRGGGDRYSDLDISLWLHDDALAKPGRIEHYVSWLGELQFVSVTPLDTGMASNCYVGPDWQRVELDVRCRQNDTPHPYFHRATIVKDMDGQFASLVAASGPPTAEPTREAARKVIEEAIYHIGFVTMQNVHGSHHHAMSNLCELANSVYTLLAQLRGREGWVERFVERFLRPDELALLYAAWPAGPEREAIRRAARVVGMDALCVDTDAQAILPMGRRWRSWPPTHAADPLLAGVFIDGCRWYGPRAAARRLRLSR